MTAHASEMLVDAAKHVTVPSLSLPCLAYRDQSMEVLRHTTIVHIEFTPKTDVWSVPFMCFAHIRPLTGWSAFECYHQ